MFDVNFFTHQIKERYQVTHPKRCDLFNILQPSSNVNGKMDPPCKLFIINESK